LLEMKHTNYQRKPFQVISSVVVLLITVVLPDYCLKKKSDTFVDTAILFTVFSIGMFVFVSGWSYGLIPPVMSFCFASMLIQLGRVLHPFLLSDTFSSPISLPVFGALLLIHILSCHNAHTSRFLCDFKTIWIDWLLSILLFPIFGFWDILKGTDMFSTVVGHFLGANMIGVGIVKAAEFFWRWKSQQPKISEPKPDLTLVHLMKIPHHVFPTVHAYELIMCSHIMFYFLLTSLSMNGVVEMWKISFLVGMWSTVVCYLGPIASKAILTPEEALKYQDGPMRTA